MHVYSTYYEPTKTGGAERNATTTYFAKPKRIGLESNIPRKRYWTSYTNARNAQQYVTTSGRPPHAR